MASRALQSQSLDIPNVDVQRPRDKLPEDSGSDGNDTTVVQHGRF